MRFRLLMVSLALLGTGAWMFAPTMSADEQQTCDLSALYAGQQPESNWVKIEGRLLWDEAAVEEGRRGGVRAYFVPLVPRHWRQGSQVAVFVRVSTFDADKLDEFATIEGLVQPMGLPFDVRGLFESEGPPPTDSPLYIHHGTDPLSQRKFANVVLALGVLGIVGFFVLGKFGKEDDSSKYGSRAQARALDEHIRGNPEAEQKLLQQTQEREQEIDRWMRERGMKKDEPARTTADADEPENEDADDFAAARDRA